MKKILLISFLMLSFNLTAKQSWVGQEAPYFDLPDQNGVFHNLNDYKGKWLVLYFYPKDDTPGCTTEALNFAKDYDKFNKLGATIVGASLDDVESHKNFADKYDIQFTLLADKDKVMANAYGVVKNLPLMNYAKRQTFLINPEGKIEKFYEKVNSDTHSQEVLTDLKALL
ncbi:MAG: peroxiredoxin [Marinicellaceae bacterium]